ncbi:MAG: phosphonopyruvate decarboxylase [Clostridium butyricum]|nr:phosphonopyruvate decarboxylase [Clostridium butyricum]
MINVKNFYDTLASYGIEFFTGVPDSLLKSFCAYITDNEEKNNIIAANEGNAIGIAAGYYLSSGKIPLVYMQNSGVGNAINPLVSLADKLVYKIPMLLLIGWRGEPNKKDEPQHKKQGLITLELMDTLGISYEVISSENFDNEIKDKIKKAYKYMKDTSEPYAIIIRKGTFEEYSSISLSNKNNFELTREDSIDIIVSEINEGSVIVSTTGMASRELFEVREKRNEEHKKDFLTVGSMGHASQIALGIALNKKNSKVYCLDGDGALIMHLGGMAIIGNQDVNNYIHIVINNGAHDSVGGQKTVGLDMNLLDIAKACGYKKCYSCESESDLRRYLKEINTINELTFLEIKVKSGARKDLGRPTTSPIENKNMLMEYLKEI